MMTMLNDYFWVLWFYFYGMSFGLVGSLACVCSHFIGITVAAASVLPNSKPGAELYNPSMHLVQYLSLCNQQRRRRGIPTHVYPTPNPAAVAVSAPQGVTAATALPVLRGTPVFQDPFGTYSAAARGAAVNAAAVNAAAAAAEMYHLPAGYAASAAYTAAAARYYTGAAAQVNPAAAAATVSVGYPTAAAAAGIHALPTDPYLGHSIGPVTGYGTGVYRNTFNRFAPY